MKSLTIQPIITHLTDNDAYKRNMLQAMFHNGQTDNARYELICRNTPEYPLSELFNDVLIEISNLCTLRYTKEELDFISKQPGMKSDFIEFLERFKFNRKHIDIYTNDEKIVVTTNGPQIYTMGFEIYVMSIISELYFRRFNSFEKLWETSNTKLDDKISNLIRYHKTEERYLPIDRQLKIFDFGTRRRWSKDWHLYLVEKLKECLPDTFLGTSNDYLAMKLGLKPIGTMGHEYLQSFQDMNVNLKMFQKTALEKWLTEFNGLNAIALTDTIGMDAFLNDFNLLLAKGYDGLRHDSGDPYDWGNKAIDYYNMLSIDPLTKQLIFSDGLTVGSALFLHSYFSPKIKTGFGIGTHFTNDNGKTPLNLVMKLVSLNGSPVAKISDSPGKTICKDEIFVSYLKHIFNCK